MSDSSALVERAAALGRVHGEAGGSEVTFGHPTGAMSARDCLELADDPQWVDVWGPATGPLSGEWADGMTPELLVRELGWSEGLDPDEAERWEYAQDELCDAYEDAYFRAWRDEVLRMAREQVES